MRQNLPEITLFWFSATGDYFCSVFFQDSPEVFQGKQIGYFSQEVQPNSICHGRQPKQVFSVKP